MSLTFGASNSDRVDCGSGATLDDLPSGANGFTVLAWLYRTADGANQHVVTKDQTTSAGRWSVVIDNSPAEGTLRMGVGRPGGTLTIYTSSGNVTPLNTWAFIAGTFKNGLNPDIDLYSGDLSTLAAEVSYGTTQQGSGSLGTDASATLYIANLQRSTTLPFKGRVGVVGVFNRSLTLGEIQSWQFRPRMMDGCVGLWNLGNNGAGTQPDLSGSGNAGTVTGATQSDNPPLGRVRRFTTAVPFAASSGTTISVPLSAISVTAYAPSVSATAHVTISVPAGALTLSAFAPTVSTQNNITVAVPAASIGLTAYAPSVVATDHKTIPVPAASMTLAANAPTVIADGSQVIQVPLAQVSLTAYAPSVAVGSQAEATGGYRFFDPQPRQYDQPKKKAKRKVQPSVRARQEPIDDQLREPASIQEPDIAASLRASRDNWMAALYADLSRRQQEADAARMRARASADAAEAIRRAKANAAMKAWLAYDQQRRTEVAQQALLIAEAINGIAEEVIGDQQ